MSIVYVNVYAVTRHFGGSEEGGWWYNAGEPLASVPFEEDAPPERVKAEKERLQELFSHVAEGNIYSVLGGTELMIRVEDREARYWPEERPYYE